MNESGLDSQSGCDEKWSDVGCILKAKPIEFPNRLDMEYEREKIQG